MKNSEHLPVLRLTVTDTVSNRSNIKLFNDSYKDMAEAKISGNIANVMYVDFKSFSNWHLYVFGTHMDIPVIGKRTER